MSPRVYFFALLVVAFLAGLVGMVSRKGERIRAVALAAGWLIPGAGHVVLGRWRKGLFFFAVLAATYLAGLWIVGFRTVSIEENPFYYVGQFGSGATMYLAKVLGPERSYPREGVPVSWYDPGLLYVCVAGLLNLVVVFNLLDVRRPGAVVAADPGPAEPVAPAPAPAPEKTA